MAKLSDHSSRQTVDHKKSKNPSEPPAIVKPAELETRCK